MGKTQPTSPEASAEPSGLGPWIKRHWLVSAAVGALVTSTIGFLVNQFGPGAVETFSGEQPLRFVVVEDENAYVSGTPPEVGFVLPHERIGALPSLASCQDVRRWVVAQGGADAGSTYLQLTIQGRNTSPVLIQAMRAQVEARREPISDTRVTCPTEGEIGVIGIGFDLDEQPAIARILNPDGTLGPAYFSNSNIAVADGEVVALSVVAFTKQCFCNWRLEVDAVIDGEVETFVVDVEGQPFETSAWPANPTNQLLWYGGVGGRWAVCPGGVDPCLPDSTT